MTYSNNIKGWMSEEELNWLYETAKNMRSIIEIGSWQGRSTHALLSGCKGIVTAVDHFRGSESDNVEQTVAKFSDIYEIFMRNVGSFNNLKVLKMSSEEAWLETDPVDMVFIDGNHSYEALKKDIYLWNPKAKKLICGHDWDSDDVKKAVTEILGKVNVIDTIWYKIH